MKFAYADPPYKGKAKKHYSDQPVCKEVNHSLLIGTLAEEYPDGWALSMNSTNLREFLPLCPADVRVLAWVKPMAWFKKGVPVTYAWEPVILRGGRKQNDFTPDWHQACKPFGGFIGAKPLTFCLWLLKCLGFEEGDVLDDLFPGTGVMGRAAAICAGQMSLFEEAV